MIARGAASREGYEAPLYLVGGPVRDLLLGPPAGGPGSSVVEGDGAGVRAAPRAAPQRRRRAFTSGSARRRFEIPGAGPLDVALLAPGNLRGSGRASPRRSPRRSLRTSDGGISRSTRWRSSSRPAGGLLDPFGGSAGSRARRVVRMLHPGSPVDDPTRAFRAARYANRLGFRDGFADARDGSRGRPGRARSMPCRETGCGASCGSSFPRRTAPGPLPSFETSVWTA